jgi:hypothetical protein
LGNYLRVKVDAAAGLPPFITWYPKAQIQSLLLKDSCLVLFIIGYGYANQDDIPVEPVSGDLMATHIQIYSTASLASNGDLVLLKETDINGYFHDAFLIVTNIHITTVSSINRAHLSDPLYNFQQAHTNLSTGEYEAAATIFAKEELIPTFVDCLISELCIRGNGNVTQVHM